jgi:hypothetical protein
MFQAVFPWKRFPSFWSTGPSASICEYSSLAVSPTIV